jgi:hypothetical protein
MTEQEPQRSQAPDSRRGALIALIFVALLVLGGLILEHILRDSSRLQDCVMQGRTNCDPIDSAAPSR